MNAMESRNSAMESRNGTIKSPKPSMDPAEDAKQPSNDGEISVHDCEPPLLDVDEESPEEGETTQTMDFLTESEQSQTLSQCADQEVMSSGEKQSLLKHRTSGRCMAALSGMTTKSSSR